MNLLILQVVNYGIGGQYEPHVDYYEVCLAIEQVSLYTISQYY